MFSVLFFQTFGPDGILVRLRLAVVHAVAAGQDIDLDLGLGARGAHQDGGAVGQLDVGALAAGIIDSVSLQGVQDQLSHVVTGQSGVSIGGDAVIQLNLGSLPHGGQLPVVTGSYTGTGESGDLA